MSFRDRAEFKQEESLRKAERKLSNLCFCWLTSVLVLKIPNLEDQLTL